jgi:hypothetical protein
MHNVEELAEAVHKMRLLQKEYFRTRHTGTLALSKEAERNVDRMLDDVLGPARLFDDRVLGGQP